MPQIVVHHLNASRSERLFWLLEELGLPYEVKVHYRTKEGRGPKSLKEISPLGKAPIVVVDGRVLTESGFITHYLLSHFPPPADSDIETTPSDDSVFWSHFSEGSLMLHLQAGLTANKVQQGFASYKSLYLLLFFQRGAASLADFIVNLTKTNVAPMLEEVERFLASHENFSGSDKLGQGDFMMAFPIQSLALGGRKGQFKLGEKTLAWLERVSARPAYQRAKARLEEEEKGQRAKL